MEKLTSIELEKASKEVQRLVNYRKRYFQGDPGKINFVESQTGFDRHGNVVNVGDKVDFCKAAPGGLGVGRIAGIMSRSWDAYVTKRPDWSSWSSETRNYTRYIDVEHPAGSACEFVIRTAGKRWTNKRAEEIILRPERKSN